MVYWSIAILIHMFAAIITQIADKGSNGISYIIGVAVGCIVTYFSRIKR